MIDVTGACEDCVFRVVGARHRGCGGRGGGDRFGRARDPGGRWLAQAAGGDAGVHGYHERTAADVPATAAGAGAGPGPPDALPGPGLPAADLPRAGPRRPRPLPAAHPRLTGQVIAVVRELGGRAARLLSALDTPFPGTPRCASCPDPLPEMPVPRVLGVDDFALRRGRTTRRCSSTPRPASASTCCPTHRRPSRRGCVIIPGSRSCAGTAPGA